MDPPSLSESELYNKVARALSTSLMHVSLAVSLVLLLPADVSVVSNLGDIVADDDLELEGKLRA